MRKIAFVVNPASGTTSKDRLSEEIAIYLGNRYETPTITFTEYKGHAALLAKQYVEQGYYAVVAVGGDGTVNEVASALIHTETALGILPVGSGNGFARHLGIPMSLTRSIQLLNESEVIMVDYALANSRPFFCTCGVGFDAFVGFECANQTKRGIGMYLEKIVGGFFKYAPEKYRLMADDIFIKTDALVVTFANASQWGNNAYIAPEASIQDGLIDVTIMSKFPLIAAPSMALRLFSKTIQDDIFVDTLKTKEITLMRERPGVFHYDGEPVEEDKNIHIKVVEGGLRVLVQRRF